MRCPCPSHEWPGYFQGVPLGHEIAPIRKMWVAASVQAGSVCVAQSAGATALELKINERVPAAAEDSEQQQSNRDHPRLQGAGKAEVGLTHCADDASRCPFKQRTPQQRDVGQRWDRDARRGVHPDTVQQIR